MKIKEALKLRTGDEILLKKTMTIEKVIEVVHVSKEDATNNIIGVNILLNNGEWYNHKEIK